MHVAEWGEELALVDCRSGSSIRLPSSRTHQALQAEYCIALRLQSCLLGWPTGATVPLRGGAQGQQGGHARGLGANLLEK